MPSLVKVLATLSSFEERIQKIERSLAAANQDPMSDGKSGKDVVREVLQEEKQEEHELEVRKLNVIVHCLAEGGDDKGIIHSILNDTLNMSVQVKDVIRMGKADNTNARKKPRPLRFTVPDMDTKRNILNVARNLKNHERFSSVFLTPDLTPRQRKEAFELRVERRRREAAGEENLVIRKGKIVVMRENVRNQNDHGGYTQVPPRRKPQARMSASQEGEGAFH